MVLYKKNGDLFSAPICKAGLKSTGDKVIKGLDYCKSYKYVVKAKL